MTSQLSNLLKELSLEAEEETAEAGSDSFEVEITESSGEYLSAATRRRIKATLAEAGELTEEEREELRQQKFEQILTEVRGARG